MNNFNDKQNTPELLSLLKLQRHKYNIVSYVSTLNFSLSVVLPIILSIIGLFKMPDNCISYINYIGAVCTIICLWLSSTLKTMKENAAKVQYVFDVQLFGFKQNEFICNSTMNDLLTLSNKDKIQNPLPRLRKICGNFAREIPQRNSIRRRHFVAAFFVH